MKTRTNSTIRHAARRGFTLLEMMVVLLIMGLLMSVAVYNIIGQGDEARRRTTVTSMNTINTALTQYNLDNGTFPATIDSLVPKYLQEQPRDAWKHTFVYFPNTGGVGGGKPFTLYSKGKGGEESGNSEDYVDYWKEREKATGATSGTP